MDYTYVNHSEVMSRVAIFKQDLASMGVELKAVCFCDSTALGVIQQASSQGQPVRVASSRVKHVVSCGAIDGLEITFPGEEQ